MLNVITESDINDMLQSLDDIHLYDPEFISISDEDYQKLLEQEAEAWEKYDSDYERKED